MLPADAPCHRLQHPAAKVLVELADLQDREVGDGTTSVVILASELLKHGNELVKNKVHPISVIQGFRLAMRQACKYISEEMAITTESLGKEALMNAARTSMSSRTLWTRCSFSLAFESLGTGISFLRLTNATPKAHRCRALFAPRYLETLQSRHVFSAWVFSACSTRARKCFASSCVNGIFSSTRVRVLCVSCVRRS